MEEFETESSLDNGPHGSGSPSLGLKYCRIFVDILLVETRAVPFISEQCEFLNFVRTLLCENF